MISDDEDDELIDAEDEIADLDQVANRFGHHEDDAWTLPREYNKAAFKQELKSVEDREHDPTYGHSNERHKFCYLCDIKLEKNVTKANPYETHIMKIANKIYKAKFFSIVYQIFTYYCLELLPYNKKVWMPDMIREHFARHAKDEYFALVDKVESAQKVDDVIRSQQKPTTTDMSLNYIRQCQFQMKNNAEIVKDCERIRAIGLTRDSGN